MRKAARTAGTVMTSVVEAKTRALAHSTGRRVGTAAKVARIIPVAYSPVMSRTPRTPIASWARKIPASARVVGSNAAASPGSARRPVRDGHRRDEDGRNPTMKTMAASSEKTVDRSDRSLVHSDRTTRAWVTDSDGVGAAVPARW